MRTRVTEALENNVLVAYAYDVANQLTELKHTKAGATSPFLRFAYSYDADGNRTRLAGRTLTWRPDNRLAAASNSSNSYRFVYNALGRVLLRDEPTALAGYKGPALQVYDGWMERLDSILQKKTKKDWIPCEVRGKLGMIGSRCSFVRITRIAATRGSSRCALRVPKSLRMTLTRIANIPQIMGWGRAAVPTARSGLMIRSTVPDFRRLRPMAGCPQCN
jgi:hypothetical protein